jgi:hypothetical protein
MAPTTGPVPATPSDDLFELVTSRVSEPTIGYGNLYLRFLLHLPRLAGGSGLVDVVAAEDELLRLHAQAEQRAQPHRALANPPANKTTASELVVAHIEERLAEIVHRDFHYLSSFRPASLNIGAFMPEGDSRRLAALATFSALDITTIIEALPSGVEADEVAVLSRMFAFDWAPRNTISRLLAQATKLLHYQQPRIRMLLTYVNPNLGFTATSYRASNWIRFGQECGTRYAYLDQDYVTDRELIRQFGSTDAVPSDRVIFSTMPLKPLDLYASVIDAKLRREVSSGSLHTLRYPSA